MLSFNLKLVFPVIINYFMLIIYNILTMILILVLFIIYDNIRGSSRR
jgi:hypothetical protein